MSMMDFPLTLDSLRKRASRMFGNTHVVTKLPDGATSRITYADISRRSELLAAQLVSDGLQPGERVGTLMWNHHAHLEAYFGVPASGGVLHTINHRLSDQDLIFIINHAQDQVLLVDDLLLPRCMDLLPALTTVKQVVVFKFSDQAATHNFLDYEEWLSRPLQGGTQLPTQHENTVATLCYTGGSTGRPKGVAYTHRGIVLHAFCQAMKDGYNIGRQDSILAVVPMFHGNGWGLAFSAALTGAKLVLPGPKVDPESLISLIQAEDISFSAGVPTVWVDLARALESQKYNTASIKPLTIITGGSAPPHNLFDRLKHFGITLYQGWGMTETASFITICRPHPDHTTLPNHDNSAWRHTQGQALAMAEVRIYAEGHELPKGTIGEVQARGASVASSYHDLDLPERWTDDGWLCTGDMGFMDNAGNLHLLERKEDLIKSGGEWIVPQDLENALLELPEVQECVVIATPHPKWGERPLALMVLADADWCIDETAVRAHLSKSFAKWQLPDAFIAIAEIPRTAVGKINRRELRGQFSQQQDQEITMASN